MNAVIIGIQSKEDECRSDKITEREAITRMAPDYVPVIYRRIIRALCENGPMNKLKLAHAVSSVPKNVSDALCKMKAMNVVRVVAWERGPNTRTVAYYGLGEGADAEPPKPMTPAERCAKWREKGNDGHRSTKIKRQAAELPHRMSLAGQMEAICRTS